MNRRTSVIATSPLRISFVGGGTDVEGFYSSEGGAVVAAAIKPTMKVRIQLISDRLVKITGSYPETASFASEIKNPIIRVCLLYFGAVTGIEIEINCEIQSKGGLATSSALCCALVLGLSHLYDAKVLAPTEIAELASYLEIERAERPIGKQDHYASSFGGTHRFNFQKTGTVSAERVFESIDFLNTFFGSVLILDTGIRRDAGEIHRKLNLGGARYSSSKMERLRRIRNYTDDFVAAIRHENIAEAGKVLLACWYEKKQLGEGVSLKFVDELFDTAIRMGAYGAKLLGAGGGGHLLIMARPEINEIIAATSGLRRIIIDPSSQGTLLEWN